MTAQDALTLLTELIKNQIFHEDYKRVTELSELYKILITGKNHEKLLKRFISREDEDMFAQRTAITQTITPAISSSLMKPFYKVGRAGGVVKKIDYNPKNDEKTKEIFGYVEKFYGNKSLDFYMTNRFTDISFTDPNSFVLVDFKPFDSNVEKAKPYPMEINCEAVMNFHYDNDMLEWMLAKYAITYLNAKGEVKEGSQYYMYLDDEIIKLTQVDVDFTQPDTNFLTIGDDNDKIKFIYELFTPFGGRVQAERVGYKRDLETNGRTFVNPFHDAMPYFMKMTKIVSELDLTVSLSAFPAKTVYVDKITTDDEQDRDEFKDVKDAFKELRGAAGKKIATTHQDVTEVELPKDPRDIMDLNKLIAYSVPPVEFLKWMQDFQNSLEEKCHRSVFNSNSFLKANFMGTATDSLIDMESVYDTLFPFAENYSWVWEGLVKLIAVFTDNDQNLIVLHKFPSDFKFKTVGQLMAELDSANKSGASSYIKDAINQDIARAAFIDDPETLRKNIVKDKFYPFKGKSKEEVLFIISNKKTTEYYSTLWANFDIIFDGIEMEIEDFYQMDQNRQLETVKKKVAELQAQFPKPVSSFDLRDQPLAVA